MAVQDDLKILNAAEAVAYIYGDTETARRLAQLAEELRLSGEPTTEQRQTFCETSSGSVD